MVPQAVVRTALLGTNEVLEFHGISDEEHWGIISHHVKVAFSGVELLGQMVLYHPQKPAVRPIIAPMVVLTELHTHSARAHFKDKGRLFVLCSSRVSLQHVRSLSRRSVTLPDIEMGHKPGQ
jgi:hypothetical protein